MTEVTSNSDYVYTNKNMEVDNSNDSNAEHPYRHQLAEFQPIDWQLEKRSPRMYLPLEETKLTVVDSQELLDEMMIKLKQVKEFAMDMVHDSYRSFTGVVCLIQVSTRTEDFVVDALKLKEEITVLNEVCTDPNILKVLHRGHADILRLQRHFGIYMVNMFDILEAARSFSPKISIAPVLKEIYHVDLDRYYETTDWRVRPIPADMIHRAREDTHYLLYVCDVYTNECLDCSDTVDLLKDVYEKCTKLCEVYTLASPPPEYNADSYKIDYKKLKGKLSIQQLECFRLLHVWRYNMACEKDKSTGYIFPSKMLFSISKQLPTNVEEITACCENQLPTNVKGITACCETLPPLVEQNITHVLAVVKKAIDYIPEGTVSGEGVILQDTRKDDHPRIFPSRKYIKKLKCFICKKRGHMAKDCGESHNETANGPLHGVRKDSYGNYPLGGIQRREFVGGYGNPRGHQVGAYGRGGYGSRGFHPNPPPYSGYEDEYSSYDHFSGYEPMPPSYSHGYGDTHRF